MTYEELKEALEIFDLTERATLQQLKRRHRELVKCHHPDSSGATDTEQIRMVNMAYKVLLEYCENYSFSFSKSEFFEQNPDELLRMQFSDDPMWGSH